MELFVFGEQVWMLQIDWIRHVYVVQSLKSFRSHEDANHCLFFCLDQIFLFLYINPITLFHFDLTFWKFCFFVCVCLLKSCVSVSILQVPPFYTLKLKNYYCSKIPLRNVSWWLHINWGLPRSLRVLNCCHWLVAIVKQMACCPIILIYVLGFVGQFIYFFAVQKISNLYARSVFSVDLKKDFSQPHTTGSSFTSPIESFFSFV